MSTLFSRIINGELPGRIVHRDDLCAAFLDVGPRTLGHTLVVPIAETDHWIDLSAEHAAHLLQVAQRIGRAQLEAFDCQRIGLVIAGYEVPHTHLHVIPTNSEKDLRFDLPGADLGDDPDATLDRAAEALTAVLAGQD